MEEAFFFLFIPAFVIGALGGTLFLVPWRAGRFYPVLLAAFSFGLFSGWGIQAYFQLRAPYLGIEPGRVAAYEGVLLDDGYESGDGSFRYRLLLRNVWDRNGNGADASGEVVVICDDGKVREWGALLFISSSLRSGGEKK